MYPPEARVNKKEFEDTIQQMREKRDKEYLKLLEERDRKNNA